MSKKDLLLNNVYLKNRVSELEIKQWWLAEQVGVDKKTVTRWIQGQVKSIQFENAEKLAKILDCTVSELSINDITEHHATTEDQKAAATALTNCSLLEKLGPIGEWNVIESLIKATIVPNLPLNILGELYDKLTIASWRQSKIDQSAQYNTKAIEIAIKTDDKCLLASALLSKANIFSWRGHSTESIQTYKECLSLEKYIEPERRGSIYSNLGAVLYERGDLSTGKIEIEKSIALFNEFGKPINLSIAHTHLALIYLQQGKIDQATNEIQTANHYATLCDYRRGLNFCKLLLGEINANRGNRAESTTLIEDALEQFGKMEIIEGLNFEIAGRAYRLLGELDKAQCLIEKGISISAEFPIYHAALYVEFAKILKVKGNVKWKEQAQNAIILYEKYECTLRAEMVRSRFKI